MRAMDRKQTPVNLHSRACVARAELFLPVPFIRAESTGRNGPARATLAFLLLALLAPLPACGPKTDAQKTEAEAPASIEKTAKQGPVQLTVRVTPKEPRLADPFDFEIVVKAPADVEVKPPAFGKAVGSFIIRDYTSAEHLVDSQPERHFHYKLEATYAGRHLLRSTSIEYKDAGGQFVLLETQPLTIYVTSELGDAAPSLANLAPLAPPRLLPRTPFSAGQFVIFGLLTVLLAVMGYLWYTRRQKKVLLARQKTPEELAREELAALLAEGLAQKGLFKEFYVRLTGIVRLYIERTTGIRAPEQTTEEFLYAMRERNVFPTERARQLKQFLEAADMVKYAALLPGERQLEESVARAQEFVGSASALAPLPIPLAAAPAPG